MTSFVMSTEFHWYGSGMNILVDVVSKTWARLGTETDFKEAEESRSVTVPMIN